MDLRCPFGCRKAHRKRESSRRSAAYYSTPEGRVKRRALNRRRYEGATTDADVTPEAEVLADAQQEGAESIVDYLCLVIGLIEGRIVSRGEVEAMLRRISRQHSLWQRGRFDYLVKQLNKDPP